MKRIFLVIICFFTIMSFAVCQTYQQELPVSFLYNLRINAEVYNLNVQLSNRQDEPRYEIIDEDTLDISDPIIGETFTVSINMNNMGTWTTMSNGDSIWQLQINSTAGNYMMLIFDDFYLPYSSKLFVYATDRSEIYGPFTDENNYPSRKFTTAPLKTNSLMIEYYKPHYIKEQAQLNIKSVGLIGKSFMENPTREFGESDPCMINAMCPEYDEWCNQRRSVVLNIRYVSFDSTIRRGTSSLLTNERRDGKPLLLTAFHVVNTDNSQNDYIISQAEKDDLQNWVFVFNYQSPSCSNPIVEPSLQYFISGATYLKGRSSVEVEAGTDFALLQLNQKPPKNYNVYYNGWSNEKTDMTETGVAIHHPQWDIKKIAKWEKKTQGGFVIWEVTYTEGGIQQGSSGSPLFNSSGYVVGQLAKGDDTHPCGKKSVGYYGRFNRTWPYLDDVLNPGNIKIISMNGDETCKENWNFTDCDDLHTSDNIFLASMGTRQYDGVYNAKNSITAENTTIQSGADKRVVFEAGNSIVLKPGFHAVSGSHFIAKIGDCERGCNNGKNIEEENKIVTANSNNAKSTENSMNTATIEENLNTQEFIIYPNPNQGSFSIKLSDEKSELQKIIITDVRGVIVYNNNNQPVVMDNIQLPNPVDGIYIIKLFFKDKILTSKFAVL